MCVISLQLGRAADTLALVHTEPWKGVETPCWSSRVGMSECHNADIVMCPTTFELEGSQDQPLHGADTVSKQRLLD